MGQQGWQGSCPVPQCWSWARGGSQGQPRVKIIRHIHGDEVRGRARKVSQQGRSGAGPGTATRVSHSLRITRQVHDRQRPWSSWEVSLWAKVQVQITVVNGQAQAWLLLWPGPSSKTSTHCPAGMARASQPGHMAATTPQVLFNLAPSPWNQLHHHWGCRGNGGVLSVTLIFPLVASAGLPSVTGTEQQLGWQGHCPAAAPSWPPPPSRLPRALLVTMSAVPGRACCTPLSCGPSPALLPGSRSAPSGLASPSCTSSDWI